jgi:hypothetical protein
VKPTIGRIVHFIETGTEWPAVITMVHSDTLVSLQVFRQSDIIPATSVPLGDVDQAPFTWHWPQRA